MNHFTELKKKWTISRGNYPGFRTKLYILYIESILSSIILNLFLLLFFRRHPSIILRRVFVFNYTFDVIPGSIPAAPPKSLSDDPNSMVIFPPEGICEG